MKNIINVDFQNAINSGMYCVADNTNSLYLIISPSLIQNTNYRVEVTDINNDVHTSNTLELNTNEQIEYKVNNVYYNGKGVMKIRLLSNEANSDYVSFICVAFSDSDDVFCKNENGKYTFNYRTKNSTGVPIATTNSLGVVSVGATLNITEQGVLNSNQGEGIEKITNTELENMLV